MCVCFFFYLRDVSRHSLCGFKKPGASVKGIDWAPVLSGSTLRQTICELQTFKWRSWGLLGNESISKSFQVPHTRTRLNLAFAHVCKSQFCTSSATGVALNRTANTSVLASRGIVGRMSCEHLNKTIFRPPASYLNWIPSLYCHSSLTLSPSESIINSCPRQQNHLGYLILHLHHPSP